MSDEAELTEASPTLVDALLRCGLAVYLSRRHRGGAGAFPSSPFARLGNASHRVLAWVAAETQSASLPGDCSDTVRRRWSEETDIEEAAAAGFDVERYFGPINQWPSFATTEERLVIEAERVVADAIHWIGAEWWIERSLAMTSPALHGFPDLVIVDRNRAHIVDYKSGQVLSEDAKPSGRYGRQVLLYSAMVRSAGFQVESAEVRPIGRPGQPVAVTNATIDDACATAEQAVSTFNSAVAEGKVILLARPGDRACGYCPHALSCPALWDGDGGELLDEMHIAEGVVRRVQRAALGSLAVELEVMAGTIQGRLLLTGLDPRRVPVATALQPGDLIRVSGIRVRTRASGAATASPGAWIQLSRRERL